MGRAQLLQAAQRPLAQGLQHAQGVGRGAPSLGGHLPGVLRKQRHQPARGVHRILGRGLHAFQEEVCPGFPVAMGANPVQQFVVHGPVLLEVEAEVQQRLGQEPALVQEHGNQQAPQAPVAIQKRVDGFKLHMRQCGLDEHRRGRGLLVQKGFQRRHAGLHGLRWRRHKARIARPGATDPVLGAPELAGGFVAATATAHQQGVHFAQQPVAQGEITAQAGHAVLQCRHVVGDFHHVIEGHTGQLVQLKQQQVRQ